MKKKLKPYLRLKATINSPEYQADYKKLLEYGTPYPFKITNNYDEYFHRQDQLLKKWALKQPVDPNEEIMSNEELTDRLRKNTTLTVEQKAEEVQIMAEKILQYTGEFICRPVSFNIDANTHAYLKDKRYLTIEIDMLTFSISEIIKDIRSTVSFFKKNITDKGLNREVTIDIFDVFRRYNAQEKKNISEVYRKVKGMKEPRALTVDEHHLATRAYEQAKELVTQVETEAKSRQI